MISYHIPIAKGLENVECVGRNILNHFGWDQSRLLKTDKCGQGLGSGEKASHPDWVTSFIKISSHCISSPVLKVGVLLFRFMRRFKGWEVCHSDRVFRKNFPRHTNRNSSLKTGLMFISPRRKEWILLPSVIELPSLLFNSPVLM